MSLILKSKEQIAGDIVRAIVSQTDITDVSTGSSLAILIESIASVVFQIQMKIMKILESSNIESLVGVALDQKAKSLGLPNGIGGFGRFSAVKASGNADVGSSFVKISTKSYAGKPSPYAGSKTLYVENASSFPVTGSLYLGRGTADRFEGPIPYTSVVNNQSFWTITLSRPMTKSHTYSDLVVLSQGGDRVVNIGQGVTTVAAEGKPAVSFTSMGTVSIPDGESNATIQIVCSQFGEVGNALAGSISQFSTVPFPGATVMNPTAFINGRSTENDEDLRKRIKNFPSLLARGTSRAIVASILGAKDQDTGKTILSASVIEPVAAGDSTMIYIDDGTGLEPTFNPQPYELLIESALGIETNLKLSQVPVTACIAIGVNDGPFVLEPGNSVTATDYIEVVVDGTREIYQIDPTNYASLQAATAYELVRDFNANLANNKTDWRTLKGGSRLVCFDKSGRAGLMNIVSSPLQVKLGLPTSDIKPLYLYNSGKLLNGSGLTASITTAPQPDWIAALTALVPSFGIRSFTAELLVGQITQTQVISDTDFAPLSTTMILASLDNWVTVLKTKFAGVSFEVIGNRLVFTSQTLNSYESILQLPDPILFPLPAWNVLGGIMDPTKIVELNVGASKDYEFNRMTGDIEFVASPAVGSKIEAGTRNTRASVPSVVTTTGLYSLSDLNPGVGLSKMVVAFDDPSAVAYVTPSASATNAINISARSLNFITMTFADSVFYADLLASGVKVGSYFLLTMDTSIGPSWGDVEGIYRIKVKDDATKAISFEVSPTQYAAFTAIGVQTKFLSSNMFLAFQCDEVLPQLVSFTSTGAVSIDALVSEINAQIFGGVAEKLNPTQLVIRSNRFSAESGNRVSSVLAVSGSISSIFSTGTKMGIQAHVASSESMASGGSAPVIGSVVVEGSYSSGRSSRSYLRVDRTMTDVTSLGTSMAVISDYQAVSEKYPKGCQHLWTSGPNIQFEGRCYNIGTAGGYPGIMSKAGIKPIFEVTSNQASGNLDNYRNFGVRVQDLGVSWDDKLVVVLDQNQEDKTISVPMGKKALIQDMNTIPSDGQPQSVFFRLKDPDDSNLAFFDSTSIFKTFDFSDFNMLTKSTGIVRNFSTIADVPRANVTILPYSTSVGFQYGDSITINDGLSNQASFKIANPGDIDSVSWTNGSAVLTGATPLIGDVVTFSTSMIGDVLPNEVVVSKVWYVVVGGANFQISNAPGGLAVTMTSLVASGNMSAVFQSNIIPTVSIVIPPIAKALGSMQMLPVTNPSISPMTVVFTGGGSPTITSQYNHGLSVGDSVIFSTLGSLPANLTLGATYWVVATPLGNTFTVSSSFGGPVLNFATAGSGSHAFRPVGIWDGDVITLNDGVNSATTFEFDSNSLVTPGNIAVAFNQGTRATGRITFGAYSPSWTTKTYIGLAGVDGDGTVTFPGHSIAAGSYVRLSTITLASPFDNDSIYYVYSSDSAGANVQFVVRASFYSTSGFPVGFGVSGTGTNIIHVLDTLNVRHDDLLTISDGITTQIYQLWLSNINTSYAKPGAIPFVVSPSAFIGSSNVGFLASSLSSAINSTPGYNILSVPAGGTSGLSSLTNQRYKAYNTAITASGPVGFHGASYTLAGMAGGVNADSPNTLATLLSSAINGVAGSLAITALPSVRNVGLTNDAYGVVGNRNIISSNSYLPLSGMAGGIDAPTAAEMRDLFVSAVNSFVSLGTLSLIAVSAGVSNMDLIGSLAGSYTIGVTSLIASTTPLVVTSTSGVNASALTANAFVLRSKAFGCPSRLAVSIRYPSLPNQAKVVVSHSNSFDSGSFSPSQSCTFTPGSTVNSASHGLKVGDKVILISSDSLPLGLFEDQFYFIKTVPTTGTFTLTTSNVDASLAPTSTFTTSGTGTLSFRKINEEFSAKTIVNVFLKSGAAAGGALMNSGTFNVTTRFVDQYTRRFVITSSTLNQTLSYQAGNILTIGGSADVSGSYLIAFADAGLVEVVVPGSSRVLSGTYQAALAPINTFPLVATTIKDAVDAINTYSPNNPIATAQTIGVGAASENITLATYLTNVQDYQGFDSDVFQAFDEHSLNCKLSGIANIYQYNSIDPTVNNIAALVQSHDSLFPNSLNTAGLSYSFVDEEVYLVPTNKVTAARWLNFVVSSSLPLLSVIENVGVEGSRLQIASDSDGSLGAVKVSNSGANQAESLLIENASDIGSSTRAYILSATAGKFVRDNLALVKNSLTSEIIRSYSKTWEGVGISPAAELQSTSEYFRPTTAVKYEKVSRDTARLYFYRADMTAPIAPLSSGTVSVTKVDIGLYSLKVETGSGILSARAGDICLFGPSSNFPAAWKFASVQTMTNVYPGHQVVAVISDTEILIAAINDVVPSGSPYTITSSSDLTFAPAIWNEKNIYTNKKGGTEFLTNWNGGVCWLSYKKIGDNFLSVWLKNSANEITDDMALNSALVSTDDFVYLTTDPTPYRLVAHNGRNNLIIYDPSGFDNLLQTVGSPISGEDGVDVWMFEYTSAARAIRIADGSSVKASDKLRVSSSVSPGMTWFGASQLGSWNITDIGWSQKVTGHLVLTMPVVAPVNGGHFTLTDNHIMDTPITFEFNTSSSSVVAGRVWIDTSSQFPTYSPLTLGTDIAAIINSLSLTTYYRAAVTTGSVGEVTITNTNLGMAGVFANSSSLIVASNTLNQGATNDPSKMIPTILIDMPNCPRYVYDSTGIPVDNFALGTNSSALGFVEGSPLSVVRVVGGTAVDPLSVERSEIFLAPKRQSNKLSSSYGTSLVAFNKLGFDNETHVGIDGYVAFSGLIKEAHKIIDGSPIDPVTYSGVRASGTRIEVLTSLTKSVSISLIVITKDGVSLGSLTETIKSAVASYINSLGAGEAVIISGIIRIVQSIPGVASVEVNSTMPVVDPKDHGKITVSSNERAFVLNANSDVTVG